MSTHRPVPTPPMTRAHWERLAPLVDALLDAPAERRGAYISEVSGGDAALAAELARFADADSDIDGARTADSGGDGLLDAAERERSALVSEQSLGTSADLLRQLQGSLGARYVVEREIGGGGMSRVFVAGEPELGRRVVIKVLPPEMTQGMNPERFAREIRLAASLQQANIVPVLAAGTAAGFPYYTMPFVEGRSLRDRLRREGALPIGDAIGILRDVARALVYAHGRDVVHRDIKPENILLSDRTAVVSDFGIAKALAVATRRDTDGPSAAEPDHADRRLVTASGAVLGTPAYMAPEQAAGDPNVDHRADLYALGCVAYELLTGKRFSRAPAAGARDPSRSLAALRPEVPVEIVRLVASCLEPSPSLRPRSAADVLIALDGVSGRGGASAPPRPRRAPIALALAVLVAASAGAAYLARASRAPLPPRTALARASSAGTTNAAALDHYLIGQTQLRRRGAGVGQSIASFERAIALDDRFARAHAGLAMALGLAPFFDGAPPAASIARAESEAHRALALDSTLADAYVALGAAEALAGQWTASDADMRRAIALDPDDVIARQTFARQLIVRGYAREGREQLQRAGRLDPTSPLVSAWLSYAFLREGIADSAVAECDRTLQLDPNLLATANFGSLIAMTLGRPDIVRQFLAAASKAGSEEMSNAPYVYAKLGDTAAAHRVLRTMERATPRPWFVDVARASVQLAVGDTADALTSLERSERASGAMWVFYIPLGDPAFDGVRRSSRFLALLRRAHVDPRILTPPRAG